MNKPDLFPEWSRTALNHACVMGDEECVRELTTVGADVNLRDKNTGLCPLHFCVLGGNSRIIEVLLHRKADVNCTSTAQEWTPLHFAAYYGNVEILKILLDDSSCEHSKIDKLGRSALHLAALSGQTECVRALLANGADLSNGTAIVNAAADRGNAHAVVLVARKMGICMFILFL